MKQLPLHTAGMKLLWKLLPLHLVDLHISVLWFLDLVHFRPHGLWVSVSTSYIWGSVRPIQNWQQAHLTPGRRAKKQSCRKWLFP
ncbi:hypothetical protein D3C81_1581700 [compost metagenome]